MILWVDLETYSKCDIKKCGGYRYAEDPSTEITLFGYAVGNEPAKVWDLTLDVGMPEDLREAVNNPETVFIAHNSMFDRNVLKHKLGAPFGDPKRWKDTMILAYSVGLPGALGRLSEVLGLPQDKAKDKDGHRLVLKFCKPTAAGKRWTRENAPEDWSRFVNYCRLDVEAMREMTKRIYAWNATPQMWADWHCDQIINDRGIKIDMELVAGALKCADYVKAKGDKEMQEATGGFVETAMQRDELLKHILFMYGVSLPNLQKATLEKRLNDENLPEPVRELIALRLSSAVASVAKYRALGRAAGADGRIRGTTQFMGASRTGRFAGRIFQPQNLPRGTMKPAQVEEAIEAIKADLVPVFYDDPNRALSNCIRGCVVASEGHKLVVADLSNIEGRVLAWLAGEKWKIEAFKAFDRGEGPDLYKATYARTFGIKADEVTKHQRQIGKVLELGLGYQGGVGAFLTFAPAYGVNLDELAAHVYEAIDHAFWVKSSDAYDWALSKKLTHGLKKNTWIACDAIKNAWRAAHPAICKFWSSTEEAMLWSLKEGDSVLLGTKLKVCRPAKGWVAVRLPSGRGLCYPSCRPPVGDERCAFTYAGVDQYTRKWQRIKTYGGKLCISEQTPVLCRRGWTPIEDVTPEDEVWDGEGWVSQGGAIMQGVKPVIRAHGVYMTPDHLVLTTEGWKDASSSERFDRLPCRIPDGYSVCWFGRTEVAVGSEVRLRKDDKDSRFGACKTEEARSNGVLRMQEGKDDIGEDKNARDVEASGVDDMAQYEAEVRVPDAQSVEELRREGNNRVSGVERVVRGILEGHGSCVQTGAGHRSDRQQRGVLEGELSVGHAKGELQQQEEHDIHRWEIADVLGGENRDRQDHAAVPSCAQLSERASVRQAGREESVYDLLNCGPRHRFVVLGEDGPLIVHNCENIVQATARDILMAGLRHAEDAGMRPVMHIHDEIVCEVPDYLGLDDKDLARLMTTDIPWAEGLPLAAAGFTATRYRKD